MIGPWFKCSRDVVSSPSMRLLIHEHGHEAATLWVMLLSLADEGHVTESIEELSFCLSLSFSKVDAIIFALHKRGFLSSLAPIEIAPKSLHSDTSKERVKRFRAKHKSDVTPGNVTCNSDVTKDVTLHVTGREKEREIERKKDIYIDVCAHEEFQESPQEEAQPPEYGRVIYDAIAAHPGWKIKPPSLFLGWAAVWSRVRPFLAGYHSDDVLAAIKAYGDIRAEPAAYWWSADLTVETFFTKHLSRFVPSADPYNSMKKESQESDEERIRREVRESRERVEAEERGK
jgi:hypothetical protein